MGNYYKERREKELHIVQNMDGYTELGDGLKTLHTIEALEWDYRRRLGTIVLNEIVYIQKATYKRNPRRKYKTNDKTLKRRLAISRRKESGVTGELVSIWAGQSLTGTITTTVYTHYSEDFQLREAEKVDYLTWNFGEE